MKKVQDYLNIPESDAIRTVNSKDLEIYKNKFFDLYGKVSRFSIFEEDKVNQFYYKWVSKSIYGELDDGCLGHYIEENLAGFVTYKVIYQKLIIGLGGVFSKFQGRKISQYLLKYINNFALQYNCTEICIATQGKNTRASNTYSKSGIYI